MSAEVGNNFYSDDAAHLAQIIDHINAGIWEFTITTRDVKWSDGFYTMLGYKPGEIECSYNFFLENLIYHHDKPLFLKAINKQGRGKCGSCANSSFNQSKRLSMV